MTHKEKVSKAAKQMKTVQLWAHCQNLLSEALKGNMTALQGFQQYVQYLPAELKAKLMDQLEKEQTETST